MKPRTYSTSPNEDIPGEYHMIEDNHIQGGRLICGRLRPVINKSGRQSKRWTGWHTHYDHLKLCAFACVGSTFDSTATMLSRHIRGCK